MFKSIGLRNKKFHRGFCDVVSKFANETSTTFTEAKSYESIPGPKGLFGIGTLYQYWPIVGTYSWGEIHKAGFIKYQKWGPIVKERMVPGVDVVWLFDPNDISKVLNNSGPGMYPQRRSHLGLEKYRQDRPHIYKTTGLLPTNGDEWWRLRSELQKGLSSPNHVKQFLPHSDVITKEFIAQLKTDASDEPIPDMLPELSRLNLELLCMMILDIRMNAFSDEERMEDSRSTRLIEAAEITNSCLLPLDQGIPLWKLFETPMYKRLRVAQEYIERVSIDLINQKMSFYDDYLWSSSDKKIYHSLLEEYLQNPKLDLADIVGMTSDLLLTGVDTVTYSSCFLLYHLANNPEVQAKLFDEIRLILPNYDVDQISASAFQSNIPYTRAVLKELFRINPVSVGVGRTLNTDLVLSGYHVPKGTVTVTQNFISCRLHSNFENPNKFLPERWLKEETDMGKTATNPYLVLPFGHGMRACIARRFAEQNMLVLLIRLMRRYTVSWAGADNMDVTTSNTINKPDQPVRIIFTKRLE